jgi:hypothetical protein
MRRTAMFAGFCFVAFVMGGYSWAEEPAEGSEEEGLGKDAEEGSEKDAGKDGSEPSDEAPPFEKLLELNGPQIFGGTVKVDGENVEILFNADGQVKAAFEGKGIVDSKSPEMTGSNRRFIRKGDKKDGGQGKEKGKEEEKLVPGLCAAGIGDGLWTSKFGFLGDAWIEMGFRVPNILTRQSSFLLRVNWDKGAGYETNFFQSIAYMSKGTPKGLIPNTLPEYKGHPEKWFPRKGDSVKVEFGIKGGQCVLRLKDQDVITLPKVADKGGKISLAFSKLVFTIDNMKISGKVDKAWCEKQLAELKKKGKLKVKEEPKPGALDGEKKAP